MTIEMSNANFLSPTSMTKINDTTYTYTHKLTTALVGSAPYIQNVNMVFKIYKAGEITGAVAGSGYSVNLWKR